MLEPPLLLFFFLTIYRGGLGGWPCPLPQRPSAVSAVSASWPFPAAKVPLLWIILKQIPDLVFMGKAKFRFISLEREELKKNHQ